MDDKLVHAAVVNERIDRAPEMPRRGFLHFATLAAGTLMGLALAVPGVAFVLTPLRKRGRDGDFQTLTRLSELEVGVPRSFVIIEERQDAWVKYPREPV